MNQLNVVFVAKADKPAWPDLDPAQIIHLGEGSVIRCAVIDNGMTSGRPSVALRFDLPDGRTVVAETSVRLFVTAARTMAARYGLFEGD